MNKTSHLSSTAVRNKHHFRLVIGNNLPPDILPNLTRHDDCTPNTTWKMCLLISTEYYSSASWHNVLQIINTVFPELDTRIVHTCQIPHASWSFPYPYSSIFIKLLTKLLPLYVCHRLTHWKTDSAAFWQLQCEVLLFFVCRDFFLNETNKAEQCCLIRPRWFVDLWTTTADYSFKK